MAGAFASGFQMGGGIFNQAERNRLEQAAEERRAQEFEWQKADRARQEGLRNEEDFLRQQLTRPNAENYALGPAGGMGGISMRAPAATLKQLPAGDTGLTMPQIVPSGIAGPAGEPTYRTTATMGLQAPEPSTRQPTFNAAPTGASAEELLGRMALLKGDTAAYRASQEAARSFRYADAYKNARQSWDAMSNDEREALISKASYDTNIPGFGTWVPGTGKTEGYMNYMAPGKDPVKLSAGEAREIYALTQAMEHDPMKARADLEKASDKVRSVLKDSFEAQTKGVTQNNLTTYHATTGVETARHNKAMEGIYAQRNENTGSKLSSTDALVKTAEELVTKGTYKDVPTAIQALKKGAIRDIDNEAWAKAEQGLITNQATPDEINTQRVAFFARRGYAPQIAKTGIETGINPVTGKKLTKADVDTYNLTYPQTPVDPSSLSWLASPEREARRQALINQIPK